MIDGVGTHNSHLPPKVVLDLPLLDRIRSILLNNLAQILDTHLVVSSLRTWSYLFE